ncbi:SDR family oxidoreductase [Pseudochryseolinea flava]|uniref:Oxidoreductase n=1 Tax=Pseudochryseolinea flava TaxID=2059302 RepID=A0A364YBW4_9BACT|nr:SDR family NAD(P)-dependent oxidoreductase [Pseudochryseolinea flava]RAW03512.1 oxidoreductase [Pseudochryseolinea flava]
MKLHKQTILITGGSSGIGLELAKQLVAKQNNVIICGRSSERLSQAKAEIGNVHTFTCDVSQARDRIELMAWISAYHPACNMLVNNAAIVHRTNFCDDPEMLEKAEREINTNLFAPIALTKMFLAFRDNKPSTAIVNITTGLVYAPRAVYPIYNATKAGLHAFTQVLRHQNAELPLKIIEVMMPVVNTPWHQGHAPKIAITPAKAVREMITGIEKGKQEIKVGAVKLLYILARIAPSFAFKKINQIS